MSVDHDIVEVEKSGELRREATDQLRGVQYVESVTECAKFFVIAGVISGLCICFLGSWLAFASPGNNSNKIEFLGHSIQTNSIGMAGIFLGTVLVAVTLRYAFNFLGSIRPQ